MDYAAVLAIVGTISGIVLGWLGKSKQAKQEARTDGEKDASLRVDVEYIKRGVDAVQVEQKLQAKMYNDLKGDSIRIEESVKQAHKRIDRIEVEIRKGD